MQSCFPAFQWKLEVDTTPCMYIVNDNKKAQQGEIYLDVYGGIPQPKHTIPATTAYPFPFKV